MKKILVSLVGNETIPNVQFIKQQKVDSYLFVTTEQMEYKGISDWIIDATGIEHQEIKKIIVDPFDYDSIIHSIKSNIDNDTFYIVNLTGGTKLMSLSISDFFKTLNAELFYLTGECKFVCLYPQIKKSIKNIDKKLTLEEYLKAYGFKINSKSEPFVPLKVTQQIFNYFLNSFSKETDILPLQLLFFNRGKNISNLSDFTELVLFLNRIGYTPVSDNVLNKKETKYLTGDWFEEYLYFQIKQLESSSISDIGTGWVIEKNGVNNEFDILYLYNDNLRLIECKTSIWLDVDEKKSIINDSIYKADSLKNKLGLFANVSIVTLSDLTSLKLKSNIERALDSKIKVYGKDDFDEINQLLNKLIK